MQPRYPVSKLLNLFFVRELASRLPEGSPLVINAVNPGFCITGLQRNVTSARAVVFWFWNLFIAWSAERGSRQLVFAALGNQDKLEELKGAYITSSEIVEPSDYVISDEGARVQKQLWVRSLYRVYSSTRNLTVTQHETLTVLSKVSPKTRSILSSNNLL